MKNTVLYLIAFLLMLAFIAPKEQSYVTYVDTEYILNKIPAYQDAQKELDDLARTYKQEIDAKIREIDSLFKVYQENEMLMTPEMKMRLKNEITKKDKQVKQLQKKYFGPDGLLAKKREELIKPIMDNIYNAVSEIAKQAHADYVFDKATGEILYANPQLDQSDLVLRKLGY